MARPTNTSDRRAQIVDALIAVMAKHGYDGASINDVARKAGLAPGLVHYHFKNKLEILVEAVRTIAAVHDRALDVALAATRTDERTSIDAVRARTDDRGSDALRGSHALRGSDTLRGNDADAPTRELAAFIDVHLGLGAHAAPEMLACWVLVMAEALREKRVRAEVERVLASLVTRVTDILERGNATKVFACADVPATAAALVATIQGYFTVAATARDVVPSGSAARCTLRMMEALVGTPLTKSAAYAVIRTRKPRASIARDR